MTNVPPASDPAADTEDEAQGPAEPAEVDPDNLPPCPGAGQFVGEAETAAESTEESPTPSARKRRTSSTSE